MVKLVFHEGVSMADVVDSQTQLIINNIETRNSLEKIVKYSAVSDKEKRITNIPEILWAGTSMSDQHLDKSKLERKTKTNVDKLKTFTITRKDGKKNPSLNADELVPEALKIKKYDILVLELGVNEIANLNIQKKSDELREEMIQKMENLFLLATKWTVEYPGLKVVLLDRLPRLDSITRAHLGRGADKAMVRIWEENGRPSNIVLESLGLQVNSEQEKEEVFGRHGSGRSFGIDLRGEAGGREFTFRAERLLSRVLGERREEEEERLSGALRRRAEERRKAVIERKKVENRRVEEESRAEEKRRAQGERKRSDKERRADERRRTDEKKRAEEKVRVRKEEKTRAKQRSDAERRNRERRIEERRRYEEKRKEDKKKTEEKIRRQAILKQREEDSKKIINENRRREDERRRNEESRAERMRRSDEGQEGEYEARRRAREARHSRQEEDRKPRDLGSRGQREEMRPRGLGGRTWGHEEERRPRGLVSRGQEEAPVVRRQRLSEGDYEERRRVREARHAGHEEEERVRPREGKIVRRGHKEEERRVDSTRPQGRPLGRGERRGEEERRGQEAWYSLHYPPLSRAGNGRRGAAPAPRVRAWA